jgi:hypothetical protein
MLFLIISFPFSFRFRCSHWKYQACADSTFGGALSAHIRTHQCVDRFRTSQQVDALSSLQFSRICFFQARVIESGCPPARPDAKQPACLQDNS